MAIKVADTFIAVSADLTAYRKGLKDADKDARSLGQQIKAALADPTKFSGSSTIANLVADLKVGLPISQSLKTAFASLGSTLKNSFSAAPLAIFNKGLSGIKSVLGGLKSAFGSFFSGLGIGAGIVSFQALGRAVGDIVGFIPSLIDKARDYALTVRTIQISTGATVEESSRFAATLDYLGGRTTKLSNLFAQMSRNLDYAHEQLNALGVVTHKANGAVLSQIQILENARRAFQDYGDGTAKADAIARAFGEEGLATFVEYLRLTDEQIRIIAEDAEASGQIISAAQIKSALIVERESNRIEMALRGIGIALLTTVGPQISAFLSNLTGWIQQNMAAISEAIGRTISFILGLVGALVGVEDGMASFTNTLFGAGKAVSPYSADLASLRSQLAQLDEENTNAAGSTDALRDAIRDQIKAVERQIELLKRQEAAEDTLFKRVMRNLAQVYQARLDNLELAERERENLLRQRDLNDQLNEAQIDLIEAQKGKQGAKGTVIDAEDVSDAMARVADIQNQQAELARDTLIDSQREGLEATRDYIESIGELLENAENKKAAVSTLRRREDVLEARRAAQLAAGDTGGAAETLARIEAVKTAIVRGEEQVRNEARESFLDKQKEMLQEELSNVKAVVTSTTAVRRAELQKQIALLEEQQAAWEKLTDAEKEALGGVTAGLNGPGGLTEAMNEAREAGVKFGEDVKKALEGLGDIFGGLLGFFGKIKDVLDGIAESDVWKFLTDPNAPGAKQLNDLMHLLAGESGPPKNVVRPENEKPPVRAPTSGGKYPELGHGGPASEGWWYLHDREQVLAPNVSDMLADLLMGQRPVLAPTGADSGGSSVPAHGHDIYMDGEKVADAQMPRVERRLADKRRY